jgi:hypothetical protein
MPAHPSALATAGTVRETEDQRKVVTGMADLAFGGVDLAFTRRAVAPAT